MELWPHQAYALDEVDSAIERGHKRICVASPTGGGKTTIMDRLIRKTPSCSVYTDRKMLFDQLADSLNDGGLDVGLRKSGVEYDPSKETQLCMVQTCIRSLRRGRNVHKSSLVIVDEFHKNAHTSMIDLMENHLSRDADSVLIGLTATPLGIGHFCDHLIQAGVVSELRECGALVPAYHFGPNEPDTKWVGKVKIDDGECGIANRQRMQFAQRVFGSVVENYHTINPKQKPTVLFAPGVEESLWFAQELSQNGIAAAHIDGENCYVDGEAFDSSEEKRNEIRDRLKTGDIKIVCNRFVLREGINWRFVEHGIFATVFGSLTSYLQAGGRFLRASPETGKSSCTIQDHGGNWWRHGSINQDREWILGHDDRIMAGLREKSLREKREEEPITCPRCHAIRLHGKACFSCGYQHPGKVRMVLQANGQLRPMQGDIYHKRRELTRSQKIEQEWRSRVFAIRKSQKPTVKRMTFAQLDARFAENHNWQYAPRGLDYMPIADIDWFRPIQEVPLERLKGAV